MMNSDAKKSIERVTWIGLATAVICCCGIAQAQNIRSDTWVATDALGRSLPVASQVGPPRANRYVGVFYFLWLGHAGDLGPFDITRILTQDPSALQNPRARSGARNLPRTTGASRFLATTCRTMRASFANTLRCWRTPTST